MEIKKNIIKTSVRNLVEFVFREGNLDNRKGGVSDKDAMALGTKIHKKIQKSMGSSYKSEVPLKYTVSMGEYEILVEGRADGIIEEDVYTIDEIKGVYLNVEEMKEPVYVHKAQAMCYGYILMQEKKLEKINIRLTYCNMDTEKIRNFTDMYTNEELSRWFSDLVEQYKRWSDYLFYNKLERNNSIKTLEFPYEYRKGQKEVAVCVYKTILRNKNMFVQAPTGVGKTMATLFPAVKAIGEELGDKIFYLTAKTITRTVANDAFEALRANGLKFKSIILTAKDKMCVLEEKECNPVACERAKGHFDRVNDAVFDIISNESSISREVILKYAQKHNVCPYEFSLDISLWVDGIICDYNYVFDPVVNLKRYFSKGVKGDYIFLVDEAHNLVDRGREMYSAVIYKEEILEARRIIKSALSNKAPKKALIKSLDKVNSEMLVLKKECENLCIKNNLGGLSLELMGLQSEMGEFLEDMEGVDFENKKELLEVYFNIINFNNIFELVDENYVIYTEIVDNKLKIKLFCVNPAVNLSKCLEKGNATIFFSATFIPIKYYKKLISTNQEDYAIYIPSPFDSKKRDIVIGTDVSSKYARRGEREYRKIFSYIEGIFNEKKGNYMVFFPSYKMLTEVYNIGIGNSLYENANILIQKPNMTETEKEEFLKAFCGANNIGFCILGGVFSEGIDLTGDKLIGAIIVGTGIPMVCNERRILMDYFEEKEGEGFLYSYIYPGMNKVLQAAGRVIRSEEDEGIIVLLDDRFIQKQYRGLMPPEWEDLKLVNVKTIGSEVNYFFNNNS